MKSFNGVTSCLLTNCICDERVDCFSNSFDPPNFSDYVPEALPWSFFFLILQLTATQYQSSPISQWTLLKWMTHSPVRALQKLWEAYVMCSHKTYLSGTNSLNSTLTTSLAWLYTENTLSRSALCSNVAAALAVLLGDVFVLPLEGDVSSALNRAKPSSLSK